MLADLTFGASFRFLTKLEFQNVNDVFRDFVEDFLGFLQWYGLSKSEFVWASKHRFKVGVEKLGRILIGLGFYTDAESSKGHNLGFRRPNRVIQKPKFIYTF